MEKHGIIVTKEGFKFLKDFEQKLEKESRKLMNPKKSRIRKVAKHIKSKRLVNASCFMKNPDCTIKLKRILMNLELLK